MEKARDLGPCIASKKKHNFLSTMFSIIFSDPKSKHISFLFLFKI